MKNFYAILFFVFSFFCFSQCPEVPVGQSFVLTSQEEINDFGTNYPNCDAFLIVGLTISGSDITDLSPLSNLTQVRHLKIIGNPLLTSLDGLNLSNVIGDNHFFITIGDNLLLQNINALSSFSQPASATGAGLVIYSNPQLTSLSGLEGIDANYVESLNIVNNNSLVNLNGLEGIQGTDYLYITNNDNLVNFSGLENFAYVDLVFQIENNMSLVSLEGLENLNTDLLDLYIRDNLILSDISQLNISPLGGGLQISNNPSLSVCNIDAICEYLNNPNPSPNFGSLVISDNAEGCKSYFQVAYACNSRPFNDDIELAVPITLNQTLEIYSTFGSESIQIPSCNDSNREDVWLTFNLETASLVDIIVDNDYNLQLWEGEYSSLIQTQNTCAAGSLNDIAITANTNYYLQVWSNDSSGATGLFDLTFQDATLSVKKDVFEGFSMYPNPVNSVLTFRGNDTIESIWVYDLVGQKILSMDSNTTQGQLDVSTLSSGMYIVKVGIDNVFESFRIVKK
nr:T9SS type A sorting domain-containing protein [uncultured Psychroserpens sp.]